MFLQDFFKYLGFEDPTNLNLVVSKILSFKRAIFSRDVVRFSNPDGQAVMCWAYSAPLVGIGPKFRHTNGITVWRTRSQRNL